MLAIRSYPGSFSKLNVFLSLIGSDIDTVLNYGKDASIGHMFASNELVLVDIFHNERIDSKKAKGEKRKKKKKGKRKIKDSELYSFP